MIKTWWHWYKKLRAAGVRRRVAARRAIDYVRIIHHPPGVRR